MVRHAKQRKRVDGEVAWLLDFHSKHVRIIACANAGIEDHDWPDALAAADRDVDPGERFGRNVVHEMDAEKTLPIRLVRRIMIDDFEIIDAVESAAAYGVAPAFVATEIERHGRFAHAVATPFVNSAVCRVCVRL